jgi:lysophospholipase L1-like esterase
VAAEGARQRTRRARKVAHDGPDGSGGGAGYPAHPRVRHHLAPLVAAVLVLSACAPRSTAAPSPADAPSAGSAATASAGPGEGDQEPLRLVTLGDGYTAGTDTPMPRRDSWPAQLAAAMAEGDLQLRLVSNLAEAGYTSEDVRRVQLPQVEALAPDIVTLQVGVNDIIAPEIGLDDYRANVAAILDGLLELLPAERLFLVTTPDHTLTQRGGDYGPRQTGSAEVARANGILAALGAERGIAVIDIAPVNVRVSEDASLVAGQGPYPSTKQYAGWVEVIGGQIRAALLGDAP